MVFDLIAQYRDEYSALMLLAFQEGLASISGAVASKGYIDTYYDFPTLSYSENGLPSISSPLTSGIKDYGSCFKSMGREPLVNANELESFSNLILFVKSHTCLHDRFILENYNPKNQDVDFDIAAIMIRSRVTDAIDRYIHINNLFEYDEIKATSVIEPFTAYIFDKELEIDIYVPLLFLDSEVDRYEITKNVYLQRMSDEIHLSRYMLGAYNVSANQSVVSSATHALVLEGWQVPNEKNIWNFNILTQPKAYPLDLIGKFFGALRVATNIDTGFAQIFSVAKGWGANSKADLPFIEGTTYPSYPSWFDNHYWIMDTVPQLTNENIESIKLLFQQIDSAEENSIDLAVRRLNRCVVRDSEEDSVLDATIALEALLSDDGTQEMTHKLALRVGAVTKLSADFPKSPLQAFQDIKKIYSYRSAIVHGSRNLSKKRLIKIDDDKNMAAHTLAIEYLKILLKILLEKKQYRDPKRIDAELLLGDFQEITSQSH